MTVTGARCFLLFVEGFFRIFDPVISCAGQFSLVMGELKFFICFFL